jgi:oligosaccharyltransferase complex subunit gamma
MNDKIKARRRKSTDTFPPSDGVLTLAGITLVIKVPRIADPKSQTVAFLAWWGILFVVYSLLISIFRNKSPGYGFALPPFM